MANEFFGEVSELLNQFQPKTASLGREAGNTVKAEAERIKQLDTILKDLLKNQQLLDFLETRDEELPLPSGDTNSSIFLAVKDGVGTIKILWGEDNKICDVYALKDAESGNEPLIVCVNSDERNFKKAGKPLPYYGNELSSVTAEEVQKSVISGVKTIGKASS